MPPYVFETLNDIPPQVFSSTTVFSMAFMGVVAGLAYFSTAYVPKKATKRDRYTWIWMVRSFSCGFDIVLIVISTRRLTP